jgi:hypothetical protein
MDCYDCPHYDGMLCDRTCPYYPRFLRLQKECTRNQAMLMLICLVVWAVALRWVLS